MASPETSLETRVLELERSLRRLRRATAATLALVIAVATLGMAADQVPPQTLVAKSIQLLDDEGRLRILINSRAGVSILDEQRRPRVILSLDRSGPGLALYGTSSQVGTILNVDQAGPTLAMRDNSGRTRALLTALDEGPALILSDENERERITLMQRFGGAHVGVLDGGGHFVWRKP